MSPATRVTVGGETLFWTGAVYLGAAQFEANVVTPLFGGIPVTGAIARTATNIKNGGRTPVAGILHAARQFQEMVSYSPLP